MVVTYMKSSFYRSIRQFATSTRPLQPRTLSQSHLPFSPNAITPSIATALTESFKPPPLIRTTTSTARNRLPHARCHSEVRTVPFTPEQLYSVVANIDEYSQFVPWCTSSRVARRVDNNHLVADLAVGFRVLSEGYKSVVTLDPYRSVSADVPNSNLFDYLITDWTFEPIGDITQLTFYVEFAFRNSMYQRVTDLFFEEVVKQMVGAFEKRCFVKYRAVERHGVLHRW